MVQQFVVPQLAELTVPKLEDKPSKVSKETVRDAMEASVKAAASTMLPLSWVDKMVQQLEARGYTLIVVWVLRGNRWNLVVQHPDYPHADIQVFLENRGGVFDGYCLLMDGPPGRLHPHHLPIGSNLRAPEIPHIHTPTVYWAMDQEQAADVQP